MSMPKFAVEVLAETKLSAKEAHFGVDFMTFFAPSEKTEREHLPAVPTAQPTARTLRSSFDWKENCHNYYYMYFFLSSFILSR